MALKKSIEINQTGVMAEYIKIADVRTMIKEDEIKIRIEIFLSESARLSDKAPIMIQDLKMPISNLKLKSSNLIEAMYIEIKNLPEMNGALDV